VPPAAATAPKAVAPARKPPESVAAGSEPEKAAPPVTAAAAATAAEPGLTEQKLWGKVLEGLLAQKKRMLHAHAAEGRLAGLSGGVARIEIADTFRCQQLQKSDYRKIIEELLGELTGQATRADFVCVAPDAPSPAPVPARAAEKRPEDPELDIPDAVRLALEVFGGELVKK
jgi:DNA polymerase-3 subunit gamma/tau